MQFFFLTALTFGLLLVPAVSLMSASLVEFQSGANLSTISSYSRWQPLLAPRATEPLKPRSR